MTAPFSGDGATLAVAILLGAAILVALLTGLRATLAAGLGRAGTPMPSRRAQLLGGLRVATIALAATAAAAASGALAARFGPAGVAFAAAGTALLVVYAEAAALSAPGRRAAARLLRPLGLAAPASAESPASAEDLRDQVDFLHQHGGVRKEDRDMLGGLLDLKDLTVSEVMVHRTRMRMLDADLPADELVAEVLASPHTRMPLYRGGPENIVGVLHAKDLFRARARRTGVPLDVDALASVPWFVPESTTLRDQLRAFLARRQHFALVVDEYGDLMGLVTLEDILEEIVGEISDEHDVAARGIRPQPDGSILADGAVPIRDLNRTMDWHLPDDEATTVAGLVIHEAMTIPEAGQAFNFHGFRFEVLRRARNRITALRIGPALRAPEPSVTGEASAEDRTGGGG